MKQRNTCIDFLKFIFALIIVCYHTTGFYNMGSHSLCVSGYIGVEFFFIVSGYLLANKADREKNADIYEANIKMTAIKNSFITYILADHSKFDEITSVSFAPLDKACIITDKVLNEKYLKQCTIKEILK